MPPIRLQPGKIVCVGLNYQHHADEMGKAVPEEPLIFLKPPSSVIASGEAIELPSQSQEVHHEGELAIVIGERTRRAGQTEAASNILGYTCANDVTARDIQRREQRYTRAKGFDTFCPLGPNLVLAGDFIPAEHHLEVRVNGEVRQFSRLDDFIFSIPRVVSFISHVMTLYPGDVILTGTPAGVASLLPGDLVEVEIEGIGILENRVRAGTLTETLKS
ncbi:MAG: fumarylacetoacetate hydrolase family protein [Bradymonadaceae bacterium]